MKAKAQKMIPLHGNSIKIDYNYDDIRKNINILSKLAEKGRMALGIIERNNAKGTGVDFLDIIKLCDWTVEDVIDTTTGRISGHVKLWGMAVDIIINMVLTNQQWINVLNKYKNVPVDENFFNQLDEENRMKILSQLDEAMDAQKEAELNPVRGTMFGYVDNIVDIVLYLSGIFKTDESINNKDKIMRMVFEKYFNFTEKSNPASIMFKLVEMVDDIVTKVK